MYIECEGLGLGAFCTDGNGLMKEVQTIDDMMNPDSRFVLTEKGEKEFNQLKQQDNERQLDD